MNEFYQQEKLSNQQLNDHKNKNKIYKDVFVAQTIPNCKLQSLNPEHSSNDHSPKPFVDQLSSTSNMSNETSSNLTDKNSNKSELSTITDESDKSLTTAKKRVTPIPASYIRRRPNLINQSSNIQLLTPNNKTKISNTDTTVKKSTKSTPIFIAPKKTSPQPHSFSSLSCDDSLQIKRKPVLERQAVVTDDHNSSIMTAWTPAPPIPPTRFAVQASGCSPDEDSDDDSDNESLLIRKKQFKIKNQEYNLSFPTYTNVPSAIFITDPHGHSHTFNPDNDTQENTDQNEEIPDNNSNSMDINILSPNSIFEMSSVPEIVLIPSTPSILLDKHTLDSIGEEEEEENNDNQTNLNIKKKDQNEIDKEPLGRRWSDGVVDQENEQKPSPQPNLTKTASVTSVIKQPENPPVKISKTKHLLMKLHLTSSSSKDDESNSPITKKRTVHRSTDKKHSRLQIPTFESNTHLNGSSTTLASDDFNQRPKAGVFTSVGNLNEADDTDDDDIDGAVEQLKGLDKRASSFKDLRGSQISLLSEAQARYGLDVSGSIHLTLTYTEKTGALDVLIHKCTDLAKAKGNTSNPYVKLYLLPDRSQASKRKTPVKIKTINPVFEEKYRYHVTKQEFDIRVLWISVWSKTSVGQNDFLGEIHIPLANCILDQIEEHLLLARKKKKDDLSPNIQPTMDPGEIQFELTYIENSKTPGVGAIQVDCIEGKAIYHGKVQVDAVCKGLLMPDHLKRKLPNVRKGPTPKWEVPLRWEGIRFDNLKNISLEISIWSQDRFRKTNIGFVRLNRGEGHFDNKPAKWLDATTAERAFWEAFLRKPSDIQHVKLPLRPPPTIKK